MKINKIIVYFLICTIMNKENDEFAFKHFFLNYLSKKIKCNVG